MPELPSNAAPKKSYESPTITRVSVSAQRELLQSTACTATDTLGCPIPQFS